MNRVSDERSIVTSVSDARLNSSGTSFVSDAQVNTTVTSNARLFSQCIGGIQAELSA